jgi:hypothetical protein
MIRPAGAGAEPSTRQPEEEPMSRLRRIALAVSVAALTSLAIAGPASAGIILNGEPGPAASQPPAQADTALRPTAIEYGLIAALVSQQPGTDPAAGPGVLDLDNDPAFDPGFGGGSIDPLPEGLAGHR